MSNEHTPTTRTIRLAYVDSISRNNPDEYGDDRIQEISEEFDRWYQAEIAAAEQRGAERALREAADELSNGEWLGVRSTDSKTSYPYAITSTTRWLNDRADRLEGDDVGNR